ncbi:vomeronasal type-1 receptor 3-like [Vombatus ursinus]|uniref:vomeronasal type-1 receptor 3-like n=1 Tax=Vombatus ursinus TaxID=29139 RepID=UPI000FFD50C9|nr:vomeronasal type-1 receptor 3-like [Vombatus ursinus]
MKLCDKVSVDLTPILLLKTNKECILMTRAVDLILINLSFSNILVILIRGIPWTTQLLQLKIFLDDIGCKIIIYLQRVSRGISLCNTCLLSVFQAITISSSYTRQTQFKSRTPKYFILFCVLIWVFHLQLEVIVFLHVTAFQNNTDVIQSRNLEFCSLNRYAMAISKFVIWKSLYDGVFVSFMVITNGYMVLALYRHHQQVQHILGTRLKPRTSPETRATKVILSLVSIFVCFYSISVIFVIYRDNFQGKKQWVAHVSVLLTLCYPMFSPFVLISSDPQVSSSLVFQGMKKPCLYPPTSQIKHL